MEAPTDCPRDMFQDVNIIITVVCGQNNIVDRLRLQGRSGSQLSNQSEYENRDDRQFQRKEAQIREIKHTETHSHGGQELVDSTESDISGLVNGSNKIHNCFSEGSNTVGSDRTRMSLTRNVSMNPMLASCLTTELRRSRNFEFSFGLSLLKNNKTKAVNRTRSRYKENEDLQVEECCPGTTKDSYRPTIYLRLRLSSTMEYFTMEPDIRWSDRMLPLWVQRVQMEEAFSWLSTLGGAYSSLGNNMYNCALEAGRVALQQLYLAERLGDATLRSRCLLYIALSLMQRGQLAKAKRLVRQQYKFATSKLDCFDSRLVSMCLGIWHHLRHHYAKRKET